MARIFQKFLAALAVGGSLAAATAAAEDGFDAPPFGHSPDSTVWDQPVPGPAGCGCEPTYGSCCDPCGDRSGWTAGADLLLLKPRLNRDIAFIVRTGQPFFDPTTQVEERPFERDYDLAPRFWLGYTGASGVGGRVRYWSFDDDTSERHRLTGPFDPVQINQTVTTLAEPNDFFDPDNFNIIANVGNSGGDTIVARADLEMLALDTEATWSGSWRRTSLLASGGVRYVEVEQSYSVQDVNGVGGLGPGGRVTRDSDHHGWGPTIGLEVVQGVGPRGLGAFVSLRGSLLAFHRDALGNFFQLIDAGGFQVLINVFDHTGGEELLAIGEVGLGVQYGGEIGWDTGLFVRAGYESQLWSDVGSPVTDDGDLLLHGVMISIGVNR